jgi:hypothetical protein
MVSGLSIRLLRLRSWVYDEAAIPSVQDRGNAD